MGKFDGILICTDLDGTLYKNDKTISRENIEAIEYFKSEGGYFTFITGRMPFYVSDVLNAVSPNAPFGCINGGGLYDFVKGEYVWKKAASANIIELAKYIDESFPGIGILVNTFDKAYFCKENSAMERFRRITGAENLVCNYNEVREPISKIIFGSEDAEELRNVENALCEHPLSVEFNFVLCERTLYEGLPKGIGKGTAVTNLCRHLDIDVSKTVAIGDYDNDISMLRAAKLGIAVSNASEAAKAAADFITVSNEEHAIAAVIRNIEEGKYNL